ncbi:hypothetical protein [Tenacibaculum sp. TC6]|uniref:hypothetical protein n=1 Tax=Tenacibaculum sp. TC6 TaxID=3423223 RepID=UPI003D35C2E7
MRDFEEYQEIDELLDKLQLKYGDTDVTYIIRNHLISLIRAKHNVGNSEIKISNKILFRFLKSLVITGRQLFKKKSIWVFSNVERRKKIGRYYYDRVASIVSEKNKDVLFIENPVIYSHKFPSKDIVLSEAFFFLGAFLFSKFKFDKNKLCIDSKLTNLSRNYEIKPNVLPVIKRFVGQYEFMSFFLKYFYKPKKNFSVYPNGYYGYNMAFKENNIPIIELQHGIIYPLHPSYNTILFDKSKPFKPDYIFTYGKKDKECLEGLNYLKKDNIFVVGSYGLQKLKENDGESVGQYLQETIAKDERIISVIATTNDIQELYDLALDLEKKSSSNHKILILPRHPIKLPDTKIVKVLDTNKTNIFEVYNVSNYLLTKASTAALEAMYMGLPVFIYELDNEPSLFRTNYPYLESLNYFNNTDDLVTKIYNKNYLYPTAEDIENIYSINVYKNFCKALEKVENDFI